MARLPGGLSAIWVCLLVACRGPESDFSVVHAEAHIRELAAVIGSRPLGTDANRRAREYLAGALTRAGFAVDVYEVVAHRPALGLSARVANLVALREGLRRDAMALVAHFDSVPFGPGAGDDAFGAALVVEAGRALAARGLTHTLVVLLTDGEEAGLMGAAGLVAHPVVRDRVRVYLNFDAIGAGGPVMLFETGPGNHWLVDVWRRAVPRPRGASYALEVYRRLPNDTDFSIFREAGLPGLNFALVGDSYAYHTDRDTADRLDRRALAEAGANAVALVRALDRENLATRSEETGTYFDLASRWAVSYTDRAARALGVLAALGGLVAWARALRTTLRLAGGRKMLLTVLWALVGAVAAGAAMVAAIAALRVSREVLHPWYAYPSRCVSLLAASGGAAAWFVARGAARCGWQGAAHPAAVWVVALPVWLLLALAAEAYWPAAAFLWTVPLAVAGAAFAPIRFRRAASVRVASLVVLVVALALWGRDTLLLVDFLVAVFGRQPVVTPVWVYPTLLLAAGAMVLPPLVALFIAPARRRPVEAAATAAWLLFLAIATGLAYAADAYTAARPLHRTVRYLQHGAAGPAVWELASHEPGLDVVGQGRQLVWREAAGAPFDTDLVAPLRHPFVLRAAAPAVAPLPGTIAASACPREDGGVALTIRATPREAPVAITVVLPPGVTPHEASWPGRLDRRGRWRATFVGASTEGVVLRARLPASAHARLAEAVVLLDTPRLPGAPPGDLLPPWLSRDRVAWTSRATYLVVLPTAEGERPCHGE